MSWCCRGSRGPPDEDADERPLRMSNSPPPNSPPRPSPPTPPPVYAPDLGVFGGNWTDNSELSWDNLQYEPSSEATTTDRPSSASSFIDSVTSGARATSFGSLNSPFSQPMCQPELELLPLGWESGLTPEGRPYYIDHNTGTTHWEPSFKKTSGHWPSNTTADVLSGVDVEQQRRAERSMSAEHLAAVFPAAEKEVIEAIVESNCGGFEEAFEKMLEITATPRSSAGLSQMSHSDARELTLLDCSEDIMWLVLRQLDNHGLGAVSCSCGLLASVVDSGQARGLIPPKPPIALAHVSLTGTRGRAMLSVLTTVLLTVVDRTTGRVLSIASGSIIRDSRAACYILTSEHNLKSKKGTFDATAADTNALILVAVNDSVLVPPKHRFRAVAHPVCIDHQHDLCVLHLVEAITTNPARGVLGANAQGKKKLVSVIEIESTHTLFEPVYGLLHSIQIGGSESIELGSQMYVFGFPISGEETLTMSTATASGFSLGAPASANWIKMYASLDNGFSGGSVVLESTAELVGVVSHSRGQVDFARPAALALPLLEVATRVYQELLGDASRDAALWWE